MSEQVTFAAQPRVVLGKAVRRLRRDGIIPGNVYGHGRESLPIQFNLHDFQRFLATHAPTTLLRLDIEGGATQTAMVRHVQHEAARGAIQHVDFVHIEMSEPIRAHIPIHLEGESPAVKLGEGMLLHLLDSIEVEALPGDLPGALTLDISSMEEVKATLYVGDVRVPRGVTVVTDATEPVVRIEAARTFTEEPAAAAATTAAEETPATTPTGASDESSSDASA